MGLGDKTSREGGPHEMVGVVGDADDDCVDGCCNAFGDLPNNVLLAPEVSTGILPLVV